MKKKFAPIQTGRIFTFVINGTAAMPEFSKAVTPTIPDTKFTATPAEIIHGETLFWQYCGTCHIINGGGGGLAPDLAYSAVAADSAGILGVVHKGGYLPLGMPKFGDRLSEKDFRYSEIYFDKSERAITGLQTGRQVSEMNTNKIICVNLCLL
jgi:quinohemoprotein ethanol dehydrogenase